mgnify:CR=1 FL=1
MKKTQIVTILIRATLALIIPLSGELFVDGWNWGLGEFVFAWVFFILLGLATTFVMNTIPHRKGRLAAGICVVLVFAYIWVRLATG